MSIAKIAALRRKVRGNVSEPAARSQGENVERFLVGGVRPRNACAYMYCTLLCPQVKRHGVYHIPISKAAAVEIWRMMTLRVLVDDDKQTQTYYPYHRAVAIFMQ